MALSTEDAQRLADLRAERDARLQGRSVQSVSSSGRSVTYAKESLDTVLAEIDRLEAGENAVATPSRRGAISFAWSR